MTTYYVAASGTNGDGSQGSPWVGLSNVVWGGSGLTAGDTLLLKGGDTFTEELVITEDGVTIGSYGDGYAIIDADDTRDYCVKANGKSNLVISSLHCKNALYNGVYIYNETATTASNIHIKDVWVDSIGPGSGPPGTFVVTELAVEKGTGFQIRNGKAVTTEAFAPVEGVLLENCKATNCGKHGFDFRWEVFDVVVRNCYAADCGATGTGHGFTIHPLTASLSSWSLESGDIYSASRFATAGGDYFDEEQRLIWLSAPNPGSTLDRILTQNTSTPTTPGAYEWGVDATKIYINIEQNPAGESFVLKRRPHGPFLFEDCFAEKIVSDPSPGVEGHGFSTDDMSGPTTWRRCLSINNEGRGFMSFRGINVTVESCVSFNNATGGVHYTDTTNGVVKNSVSMQDTTRGVAWTGDAQNGEVTNTIVYGVQSGVFGSAYYAQFSGTVTSESNVHYNASGATKTNNISATEVDPLLVDPTNGDGRLQTGSPCIRAGAKWWTSQADQPQDQVGLRYPLSAAGKPDIGAYAVREDAGYARKAYAVPAGVLEAGVDIAKARKI